MAKLDRHQGREPIQIFHHHVEAEARRRARGCKAGQGHQRDRAAARGAGRRRDDRRVLRPPRERRADAVGRLRHVPAEGGRGARGGAHGAARGLPPHRHGVRVRGREDRGAGRRRAALGVCGVERARAARALRRLRDDEAVAQVPRLRRDAQVPRDEPAAARARGGRPLPHPLAGRGVVDDGGAERATDADRSLALDGHDAAALPALRAETWRAMEDASPRRARRARATRARDRSLVSRARVSRARRCSRRARRARSACRTSRSRISRRCAARRACGRPR